jgi:hypothetical protein
MPIDVGSFGDALLDEFFLAIASSTEYLFRGRSLKGK